MPSETLLPILEPRAIPRSFDSVLRDYKLTLTRAALTTVQINVGKLCNQACQHCHVAAGPKRTEIMSGQTANRIIELLAVTPEVHTVDITGGAPELNSNFRRLVCAAGQLGQHVIDRCNLTVLFEPGQNDLGDFLAKNEIEIVASLPCYTRENVDKQRGRGVFELSIAALRKLNDLGYGRDPKLALHLMFNPGAASLPPPQPALEAEYKLRLREDFGILFNRLLALTNMPIQRFADFLHQSGRAEAYQKLLIDNFNAGTVEHLMCRSLISVSWDGKLYDCDFNQMLEIPAAGGKSIWDVDSFSVPAGQAISTADHCFGCTAGAGSSCGGALE